MSLTSDPDGWLRPFFVRLQTEAAFHNLAPAVQFNRLCDAVAVDHPNEAEEMRHWSNAAQNALMERLAASAEKTPPAVVSELWQVTKDTRTLRCVVHYMASGLDVRLFEGDGLRRSQLCADAREAEMVSQLWHKALVERGWN